jgi:hypothetical protein
MQGMGWLDKWGNREREEVEGVPFYCLPVEGSTGIG